MKLIQAHGVTALAEHSSHTSPHFVQRGIKFTGNKAKLNCILLTNIGTTLPADHWWQFLIA